MGHRYNYRIIIGGNRMANVATIEKDRTICLTCGSCKSDWEMLQDIFSTEAKKKGLTKADSRKLLQRVRQMDDSNSRY
jgi:hypothetical protein